MSTRRLAATFRSPPCPATAAISEEGTEWYSPSQQSSRTSPGYTWISLVSTLTNKSVPSDRLRMWLVRRFRRLLGREQADAGLVLGNGMIARQQASLALADQIAARIAGVRHDDAIVAESARHQSGCHGGAARTVGSSGLINLYVGLLRNRINRALSPSDAEAARKPAVRYSTAAAMRFRLSRFRPRHPRARKAIPACAPPWLRLERRGRDNPHCGRVASPDRKAARTPHARQSRPAGRWNGRYRLAQRSNCSSCLFKITEKRRADLDSPPGPHDTAAPPRGCGYCAAMNRLLTSVVRPLDLLERMK